jgi:M6 family metalloprotease-like protein
MNTENIPASGPIKIAFIPVDFADVPGSYAPLSKAQADMDILSRWVSVMSGGRSSVEWVIHNSWLRASKTSNSYPKTVEGSIAQEAFNLADPFINFSGVHTAIVYVPSNIGGEYSAGSGINLENRNFSTNEGSVKNVMNAGAWFYRADKNVWGGWAHMLGHGLGLVDYYVRSWSSISAQPMSGWEIMAHQDGPSQSMAAWNRWLLGWLTSEQVYCIPQSSLTSTEVTLVPINRDIAGFKTVMIPLTATTVLVVESRRGETFDSQLGSGVYGVIAYTVDTTIDNGNGLAAVQVPAAHAADLPTTHGYVKDALILIGESVTVSGVTVRLVKSGDFDTVQISK